MSWRTAHGTARSVRRQNSLRSMTRSVAKYSLAVLGPVLDGIRWGIASNPKGYDRVTWNIREARNDTLGLTIPMLRIFFSIENEDQENESVLLLWIEEIGTSNELGQS